MKFRPRLLTASLLLVLPGLVQAGTEVTPFFTIEEALVDSKNSGVSDSGQVTTLTPGISLFSQGSRASLALDYQVNAVYSSGLDQEDREVHLLDFLTRYEHTPGKWISSLGASSRLSNIDVNGVQNIDPGFIDDNSRELRTVYAGTQLNDRLTDTIQYQAGLNVDYAGYADTEDGDDTRGRGLSLGLDNQRSRDQITWSTALNRRVSENDDFEEQIDTFNLRLNYRINSDWSSFVNHTRTETDTADFDDSNLLGFTWSPNTRSRVSAGAGKRGDDNSYSLDASHIQRNLTYTASYTENITTSRSDTLDLQQMDVFGQATSQSISIVAVLQKRANLGIFLRGKRSSLQGSWFQQDTTDENRFSDQTITGLQISYSRELSALSQLSVNLLKQESDAIEANDLLDLGVTYARSLGRSASLDFSFSQAEQTSSLVASEYERSLLSARYRVSF